MANTYTLIASVTVGSGGAATMSFTSIPSTYTDLVLKISPRGNRAAGVWNGMTMTVNGSSSTFSSRFIEGGDSTVVSGTGSSSSILMNSVGVLYSSTFASNEVYIPNYAGSTNKCFSIDSVSEGNQAGGVYQDFIAGLWSTTSAITSITLTSTSFDFVQYSTATLYGIKNS